MIRQLLDKLLPEFCTLLEKCKIPSEITKWRNSFISELNKTRVEGEIDQPQEEAEEFKDQQTTLPIRIQKGVQKLLDNYHVV
jgi:hypothetical protein